MRHHLIVLVVLATATSAFGGRSAAQELDKVKQASHLISEYVQTNCPSVPLHGSETTKEITPSVQVSLSQFLSVSVRRLRESFESVTDFEGNRLKRLDCM